MWARAGATPYAREVTSAQLLSSADARARLIGGVICGALAVAFLIYAFAAQSWYGGILALLALIALFVGLRSRSMQLEFEVGQQEKHRVHFSFNKFWGNLAVTVDGSPVVRDLRTFSVSGAPGSAWRSELLERTAEFSTAAQIHDNLRHAGEDVGLTTDYRTLQLTVDGGQLDAIRTDEG